MGLGGSKTAGAKRKHEDDGAGSPSKKIKLADMKPLYDACVADNLKEVVMLLRTGKYDNLNQRFGDEQDTALLQAARNGNVGIVCALLSMGADASQLDSTGWSALHSLVTDEGGYSAIKTLLELAPKLLNLPDQDGWNPLMISAQEENAEAVMLLLKEGADPTVADEKGRVTLHWAASGESKQLVKAVLDAWPEGLNKPDVDGRTPIMIAAENGSEEVVRFLKEQGANLDMKDVSGNLPIDYARNEEREEIVEILSEGSEESEKNEAKNKDGSARNEKLDKSVPGPVKSHKLVDVNIPSAPVTEAVSG